MFVIFAFAEGTVEAVPKSWCLNEESCYWPPQRLHKEITKLISTSAKPDSDWILYEGKILLQTALYKSAREHLKKSEVTSDLASEGEFGRGKRRRTTVSNKSLANCLENSDSDTNCSNDSTDSKIKKKTKGRKKISLPEAPPIPTSKFSGENVGNRCSQTLSEMGSSFLGSADASLLNHSRKGSAESGICNSSPRLDKKDTSKTKYRDDSPFVCNDIDSPSESNAIDFSSQSCDRENLLSKIAVSPQAKSLEGVTPSNSYHKESSPINFPVKSNIADISSKPSDVDILSKDNGDSPSMLVEQLVAPLVIENSPGITNQQTSISSVHSSNDLDSSDGQYDCSSRTHVERGNSGKKRATSKTYAGKSSVGNVQKESVSSVAKENHKRKNDNSQDLSKSQRNQNFEKSTMSQKRKIFSPSKSKTIHQRLLTVSPSKASKSRLSLRDLSPVKNNRGNKNNGDEVFSNQERNSRNKRLLSAFEENNRLNAGTSVLLQEWSSPISRPQGNSLTRSSADLALNTGTPRTSMHTTASLEFDASSLGRSPEARINSNNLDYLKGQSDEKFKRTVILMLTDLNTKMDTLLNNSKESTTAISQDLIEIEEFPDLPLASLQDVKLVERLLMDKVIKRKTVKMFASYGGKKVKNCCQKLFNKVLTHEVTLQFNWVGSEKKYPFVQLELKNVFVAAVQMNFKGLKEFQAEDAIKKYLKGAFDRNGGRAKRRKKAEEVKQKTAEEDSYGQSSGSDTE